jgi:acetylornithine deacetylase
MLADLAARGVRPAIAIVGEPTTMRIIEGHKGCCEYTTTFTGLEGHASRPELGVNAIEYAVRYVGRLMEIGEALKRRAPAESAFTPPWSTVQAGRISGGVSRNTIAGKCAVEWELRPVNAADFRYAREAIEAYVTDDLLPAMRRTAPAAEIVTEVIGEVAGLVPMEKSAAEALVRALTGDREPAQLVSFGTEAGLFQQHGVSTVICGPGSIEQAHKPDEFIELAELDACLRMIEGLRRHLG